MKYFGNKGIYHFLGSACWFRDYFADYLHFLRFSAAYSRLKP